MGFYDNLGTSGQDDDRDEIQTKKTILKDGQDQQVLGGVSDTLTRRGSLISEQEYDYLLTADDGVITTTDPMDKRYPHVAGRDYKGNLVSAGNLHRCMEKGCRRLVSNLSGAEYKPGLWRCAEHYRWYDIIQFFKWFLSPFYKFMDDDQILLPPERKDHLNETPQTNGIQRAE